MVYILPEKTTPAQLFGFQPRVAAPALLPTVSTAAASVGSPTATAVNASTSMAAPEVQASPLAPQASPMAPQAAPVTPQASPLSVDGAVAEPTAGAK